MKKLINYLKWIFAFSKTATLKALAITPLTDEEFELLKQAFIKHNQMRKARD